MLRGAYACGELSDAVQGGKEVRDYFFRVESPSTSDFVEGSEALPIRVGFLRLFRSAKGSKNAFDRSARIV
jgi:hypothetical protein